MEITLNNTKENLSNTDKITVSELIALKKFTFKMLVVKINDKVIKKEDYESSFIYNGDNVLILHLISGG